MVRLSKDAKEFPIDLLILWFRIIDCYRAQRMRSSHDRALDEISRVMPSFIGDRANVKNFLQRVLRQFLLLNDARKGLNVRMLNKDAYHSLSESFIQWLDETRSTPRLIRGQYFQDNHPTPEDYAALTALYESLPHPFNETPENEPLPTSQPTTEPPQVTENRSPDDSLMFDDEVEPSLPSSFPPPSAPPAAPPAPSSLSVASPSVTPAPSTWTPSAFDLQYCDLDESPALAGAMAHDTPVEPRYSPYVPEVEPSAFILRVVVPGSPVVLQVPVPLGNTATLVEVLSVIWCDPEASLHWPQDLEPRDVELTFGPVVWESENGYVPVKFARILSENMSLIDVYEMQRVLFIVPKEEEEQAAQEPEDDFLDI